MFTAVVHKYYMNIVTLNFKYNDSLMAANKSLKEDPEIFYDESVGNRIIEAEIMRKLLVVFEIARKSVCKVITAQKEKGTGYFLEVFDKNGQTRFLFMTCNHVLPTNSLNEIFKMNLEFEDIPPMTKYNFENDRMHVKYIWTSKLYDATIIEISSELVKMFKESYGMRFLEKGQITNKDEVAILQYPKCKFGIAYGEIDHMNDYDVFYKSTTAPGSSGSPLLNWDGKALAMHNSSKIFGYGTKEEPQFIRRASDINAIINVYLKDQEEDIILCVNTCALF